MLKIWAFPRLLEVDMKIEFLRLWISEAVLSKLLRQHTCHTLPRMYWPDARHFAAFQCFASQCPPHNTIFNTIMGCWLVSWGRSHKKNDSPQVSLFTGAWHVGVSISLACHPTTKPHSFQWTSQDWSLPCNLTTRISIWSRLVKENRPQQKPI